jgi:23S rRNA pseudouridine2605 synthase
MENNKRGRGSRKQSENDPEKRSLKTSRSSYKPAKQEKPYKKEKPSESGRDKSEGFRKDKPSEFRKDKPSVSGKRPARRSDDKPSSYSRGPKQEYDDSKPSGFREKRTSYSSDKPARQERPYKQERPSESGRDKPEGFRKDKPSEFRKDKPSVSGKRPARRSDDKPSSYSRGPKQEYDDSKPSGFREKRTSYSSDKPARQERPYKQERPSESGRDKPSVSGKRPARRSDDKPSSFSRGPKQEYGDSKPSSFREKRTSYSSDKPVTRKARPVKADENAPLRLNKFIANAGVCSRREADKLIESGAVKVNGVIVTELGTKVTPSDKVQLGDQTLSSEKLRYVLLNKPKGFITTTDDPFKRNTVMKLVAEACRERIYPVGRLDRNTTGLLLFTNDGELAKRLTHPRFGIRKIYAVELDKPLSKKDMESIASGVDLDGETIIIDEIAYVEYEKDKKHIGIQLHSGQNRVVRRIFEKFGYDVVKLDRVMIGSLTKKDLPRGIFRHLTPAEVRVIKRL